MSFKNIFFYEIKTQMKSKIFYAFIIIILINLLTNYSSDMKRLDPLEADSFYGFTSTIEEKDVLYRGYELLYFNYLDKKVIRYIPLGSYKNLSDSQVLELKDFLDKMAPGKSISDITRDDFKINTNEMFEFMKKFDKDVGGKTNFTDEEYFHTRLATFEEANEKRYKIKVQDEHTRSYARLFSDYNGIAAALFVGFIAVFSMYRDTKVGDRELHYTSNTSAINYIFAKFLGVLVSAMGVFLLFAILETIIFTISALQNGENIDLFAFIGTTLLWITPTLMFSIALSFFIYVVSNKFSLSLISQLLTSYYMLSSTNHLGDYRISRLIIRFNALAPYEEIAPYINAITINRVFYILLSILILIITSYIWNHRKISTLESISE